MTVDYTGGGTFTLGNSDKSAALTPAASADATLKISSGTLSLFSGNVNWSQKLVMGDGTTLTVQDGPAFPDIITMTPLPSMGTAFPSPGQPRSAPE